MVIVGPALMFGGLLVLAWVCDRQWPVDHEQLERDAALERDQDEDQAREERELDREAEPVAA